MVISGYLQSIDHLPHVAIADLGDVIQGLVGDVNAFLSADFFESVEGVFFADLLELEAGGTGLQCGDDLGDVVADHAEAGGTGVLLHDAAKGGLGVSGHSVGLVEDDDLRVELGVREVHSSLCEGLDDLAHHVDASRVTGVELR